MVTLERSLVEQLSSTNLSKDSNTKDVFNNIVYNAFHNCTTNYEETILVTLAYKYNLNCYEEILGIIETEKDKLPF